MIKNQTEIIGVSMIDHEEYTWSATSLLCDKIYQITNAKTYVFADSVLFLGGVKENLNEAWKVKIKWYFESDHLKDLNRIDGEPMEFEWKIFQGWIPGRQTLKRGRQSVFFTFVNPMEDDNCMEETPCDLTKPRIAPYKDAWRLHQNTVYCCNLKFAWQRGLQF